MNRLAGLALLVFTGSIMSSCSFFRGVTGKRKAPGKKIVWAGADTTVQPVAAPVVGNTPPGMPKPVAEANPLIEQLRPVWEKRLAYKTFTGKAKMEFGGPDNSVEFTGHIRIKKDSLIWINITALSGMVQAARIMVTPDSFFMINYQQGEVTILPLSKADKFLPAKVDFSSLQNLILGEPMRQGSITGAQADGDSLVLQMEDTAYLEHTVYSKADSSLRTAWLRTRKPGGPIAQTDYSDYSTVDNRRIAAGRVINLLNGKDTYHVYMRFTKIDFDAEQAYPFGIQKGYTIKR